MAFVSMLDDSSPEKIRKSIFIFASVITFSMLYELEITAPSSLFSSASGTGQGIPVKITYDVILALLAAFQTYLLVRLYFSWKISKAKFRKFFITDEFNEKTDTSELLKELDKFSQYSNENPFPLKISKKDIESSADSLVICIKESLAEIDSVSEALRSSKNGWENINTILASTNKLLRTLISDKNLLSDSEQAELLKRFPHIERVKPDAQDPKFIGNLYEISSKFIEATNKLESSELKINLRRMQEKIGSVQPKVDKISEELEKLTEVSNRYETFSKVFPKSVFRLAIDIDHTDLTKVKKLRELELDIFEFWFPTIISIVAIVFSFSPYVECIESIVNYLRVFSGVIQES